MDNFELELALLMKEAEAQEERDKNFARFEALRDKRNVVKRAHLRRMTRADNKFAAAVRANNWGALRDLKLS